ncbi:MAG: ATP-binding protein [Gammaproteobacteria bacterium]|nr:ATP-binding protein [Gammaproteobacteria bacterium]MBU2059534.1 ATP-binding protein [Gammaproteobacteria bacterium]MBU2176172.1 ATP-binding protein [Gammaproteobacteria bacterium]MBU2248105.1 ATP-binding protein [Gammaproteobacteria bacterium]MBU2344775.1 ATP-binding protein [Gammaproteobacteria bacterium]
MEFVFNSEYQVREVQAAPYASSLIEGHRDFGYSLETALADIVDNSITAGASEIRITAITSSDTPHIAIVDNGSGMAESELVEAMRLGAKNPTHTRLRKDLGRFGLGMKSASFSQCRQLTVISRKDGDDTCAIWDLDHVALKNDWSLTIIGNPTKLTHYPLLTSNGTAIIWEKLDRLLGDASPPQGKSIEHANAELVKAERHLCQVFHRFLQGSKPRISLYLNKRKLRPLDPLCSDHPATQKDPEEIIPLSKGNVRIRCHTLPHHRKMDSEYWDELAGPEGHVKSQGLYIYREDRLIIAGGWLGLTRQTELTKLCRIAIDIPNTMDTDWKIDVKKASAQLPPQVRERLKRIIERFVGTSKRTYSARGKKLVDEDLHPLWNRVQANGQISFKPNLEHPVFSSYANQLPDNLKDGFYRCIRLVGSGLPIDTLHTELVGNPEAVVSAEAETEDLRDLVNSLAETLLQNGVSTDAISNIMQANPYLRDNWETVTDLLLEFLGKK